MRAHAMKAVICIAIHCALLLSSLFAQAQTWKPEKNIEMLIGLSAGSSQDRTGRALQKVWQDAKLVDMSVNVVNRVGGGGQVALSVLSQRAGDAHTLYVGSPTFLTSYLTGTGAFRFTDFTPLALLGNQYLAIAVRPASPIKNARDLLERLKRDPYTFSFGINGTGGTLHIVTGLVVRAAGGDPKKARIIAFQGGELMTAGIGGHVDAIVTVASNILPHVETGKLNMLGVTSTRRLSAALAAVPTFKEQGIDLVLQNWAGLFGAKDLTRQQIAYWDGVLAATVSTASWKSFAETNQWEAEYLDSAQYRKHLLAEDKRLRAALMDLGLTKQ